ncbi:MAG: heparinase II/III-family protein [Clostridia bacterium]|nr:heparinase II/III-family protein [Clostridia bacterium]
MKVFSKKEISNATAKLLPYSEFRLFSDVESPEIPKEKGERIVRHAEGLLGRDIPLLPASVYRQYVTVGNRSNYEDIYFLRRDMAVTFAVAEAYENKGRFTEKLMDVVWAIMEESTWIIPAHIYCAPLYGDSSLGPVFGDNALHGLDLFAAATAGALSTVYLLCKDKLDNIDPVICRKMEYCLHERAIKNFLQIEVWWGGALGRKTNNWCPWIVSNILLTAAIMEKDNYTREKVVTKSMSYLDNFLDGYEPDGGCDEGPAYWGAAGASLFDCLELIEDMSDGKISVYDSELVKNIGDYIYKVNITGNRYVNFADCAPKTDPTAGMLIRFGEKTNSPFLVAFGKKQAKFGDYFFSQSHMYRSLKWLCTPFVKEESCPMPLWSVLPDLGVITAREYDESEKGMFLAAKAGNNGEMHNHNDCGNFMVYYNGNPVIIDTGVGRYTKQTFSRDRYKLWFMQSGYHNLPSFGGIDQKDGVRYAATDKRFSEEERSITSELKGAYPVEAGIKSYVRRVALTDGTVTVDESIILSEAKEIDFHLMLAEKPSILQEGLISLPEGRILTYDTSLKAELEEFEPVGMDTAKIWGTDVLYRLRFRVNTDKCNVRFTIK